jgi:LmbE family N-acetylglucosaminyl deacetylase
MKVKTTVHIYHSQYSWEKKAKFQVYSLKIDDTEHMTYVGSQEIEIDVPDSYDPTAQKIAALEEHKKQVMANYQKTVNEINERISKLQAIEYTA